MTDLRNGLAQMAQTHPSVVTCVGACMRGPITSIGILTRVSTYCSSWELLETLLLFPFHDCVDHGQTAMKGRSDVENAPQHLIGKTYWSGTRLHTAQIDQAMVQAVTAQLQELSRPVALV